MFLFQGHRGDVRPRNRDARALDGPASPALVEPSIETELPGRDGLKQRGPPGVVRPGEDDGIFKLERLLAETLEVPDCDVPDRGIEPPPAKGATSRGGSSPCAARISARPVSSQVRSEARSQLAKSAMSLRRTRRNPSSGSTAVVHPFGRPCIPRRVRRAARPLRPRFVAACGSGRVSQARCAAAAAGRASATRAPAPRPARRAR